MTNSISAPNPIKENWNEQKKRIKARKVIDRNELRDVLKEMLEFDGPYFLEVKVEKEENVFPMIPTGAAVCDMVLELKK